MVLLPYKDLLLVCHRADVVATAAIPAVDATTCGVGRYCSINGIGS